MCEDPNIVSSAGGSAVVVVVVVDTEGSEDRIDRRENDLEESTRIRSIIDNIIIIKLG
jgi:hypothetical protein